MNYDSNTENYRLNESIIKKSISPQTVVEDNEDTLTIVLGPAENYSGIKNIVRQPPPQQNQTRSQRGDFAVPLRRAPPRSAIDAASSTSQSFAIGTGRTKNLPSESGLRSRPGLDDFIMDGISIVEFDEYFNEKSGEIQGALLPVDTDVFYVHDATTSLWKAMDSVGQIHCELAEVYRKISVKQAETSKISLEKKNIMGTNVSMEVEDAERGIVFDLRRKEEIFRKGSVHVADIYKCMAALERVSGEEATALVRKAETLADIDGECTVPKIVGKLAALVGSTMVTGTRCRIFMTQNRLFEIDEGGRNSQGAVSKNVAVLRSMAERTTAIHKDLEILRARAKTLYASLGPMHERLDAHCVRAGVTVFVNSSYRISRRSVEKSKESVESDSAMNILEQAFLATWNATEKNTVDRNLNEFRPRMAAFIQQGNFINSIKNRISALCTELFEKKRNEKKNRWNVMKLDELE